MKIKVIVDPWNEFRKRYSAWTNVDVFRRERFDLIDGDWWGWVNDDSVYDEIIRQYPESAEGVRDNGEIVL